jgi:hypothetical protein
MASQSAPVHRAMTHKTFAVQKSIVSSRRRPSSNGHRVVRAEEIDSLLFGLG